MRQLTRYDCLPNAKTRTASGLQTPRIREGVLTGFVLKLLRGSLRLTQEDFAERLGVDKNTAQGWESARRSLNATRSSNLIELRHRLRALGAPAPLIDALSDAMEADYLLGYTLSNERAHVPLSQHPLANWVIKRPFAEMLAWPFTGEPPAVIGEGLRPPGRGPVASRPSLGADECKHFFHHLREAAERSLTGRDSAAATLLRRQACYLAAWSDTSDTKDWLGAMHRAEQQLVRGLTSWSPNWVAARSLLVARARRDDPEPLRHFIRTGLVSDQCEAANLNYWAYWIGELSTTECADEFMATDLGPWSGARLLHRLVENLSGDDGCLDLYVHSIWALLQRRPHLARDNPSLRATLVAKIEQLLDAHGCVAQPARRELEHVRYALQMLQPAPSLHPQ